MRGGLLSYIFEVVEIFNSRRIPRSSAALSYCLMLSIFPTLICVHAVLVKMLPGIELTLADFDGVIPESALTVILDYLQYVSLHNNSTMFTAGIIGMITTTGAAFRTLHGIMADIQGESRFKGIFNLLFSFVFSFMFLLAIYFAAIVMVSGNWIMTRLANAIPVLGEIALWQTIKYPILLVVFVFIIYGLYRITAPKGTKDTVFPGAILAAVLLVLASLVFSSFINMSTRYPLIYGSLASIIICMLWLYVCGLILVGCNIINFVIRRRADEEKEREKNTGKPPNERESASLKERKNDG